MMTFDVGDDEPEKVRNSFKNALGGRFSRHLRRKESVVFFLRKSSELRSELVGEPAKHRSGIESVKKEELISAQQKVITDSQNSFRADVVFHSIVYSGER
jgi:hypothetical protein